MTPGLRDGGAPAWALTFGDLMSMMLTFFVMLSSYATLDARRFEALADSLQSSLGGKDAAALVAAGDAPTRVTPRLEPLAGAGGGDESTLALRLRMAVRERRLERLVAIEPEPEGVVIRLPGQLLFAEGSAELRSDLLPLLHEMAGLLADVPGDVSIEGHAADAADPQARFVLSCARALAVLRHLIEVEGFDRRRLRATGFGDVRPLVADSGPRARARNRRIEFVLLREAAAEASRELAELEAPSGRRSALRDD